MTQTATTHTASPTPVSPEQRLGQLATRLPGASRVFMRHHLDFCCGGAKTLRAACEEAGLDPDAIAAEIASASASDDGDLRAWETRPLDELTAHIIRTYHEPLREELPRLQGMAHKVYRVHGDKDPEGLGRLAELIDELSGELFSHMAKEEQVLFPWIDEGRRPAPQGPVRVMLEEHESAGAALDEIRDLTCEFVAPRGACATWRALWLGLSELDEQMRHHIHLENNILFPRALEG